MYGFGIGHDCYWSQGRWHSYSESFGNLRDFRAAVDYGWTPPQNKDKGGTLKQMVKGIFG